MDSAYYDRMSGNNQAVLLVESIQKEFILPATSLPSGSKPGSWFHVTVQNDTITSIKIDEAKTSAMKDDIQSRLARLQSNKKSRFKRR
ncbi:DUF3006 domain-containing protein [Sporosarcina pasteurii]|uniref:Protein of uncharacterized function (DUF3006) n=1 Tax=Sporosarcina pasteurii TaxID=1474 RepID=A0A380C8Z3_SPOPA|nr:DUF3006 domain-containing protein [Sporosarcina pasteurii]MDS9473000.1 DUF3006 domain-containing protein [Sporosarcina pasteurii]QBQ04511.1 DUF3006 domain-containing protein [Sporosarcina pasteurii]SUJ14439.1 Protein of uncharacterised function (DUF3006) [Sporosarcina pasteurii]